MRDQLSEMVEKWNEEHLVGTVISKNVSILLLHIHSWLKLFHLKISEYMRA